MNHIYLVRKDGYEKWIVSKFEDGASYPVHIYIVNMSRNKMWCNCPHGTHRRTPCKHISFVKDHIATGRAQYES